MLEKIPSLVNWMSKTLGRIIENEVSSPDICCRNVQFEMNHLNITHTWCSSVFARSLNKANRQKPSITQYELRKTSIKFHVPSLNKCQRDSLILRTFSGCHRLDKSCFNSHCQKNFFSKSCSPVTKFPRNVFFFSLRILALVIGSCDPAENLTGKNIVVWVGQRVCMQMDRRLYCSVWQRLPNL